jgi:EpsI family protein
MVSVWLMSSTNYSHGIIIPFIAAYILFKEWNQKGKLFHVYHRIYPLFFIAVLSIIWLVAHIIHVQVITQLVYIFIMCFFLIGLFGRKQIGSLLFPILLLLTAIPIWTSFSEPLQIPTAYVVDKMLHLTGYVALREGYIIHIPEGSFEVSDICSGVNNQIASLLLSLLLAYNYRLRIFGMLAIVLLGSFVAFFSNSIRIYIVVLSGHYSQMKHSLIDDHVWLGWVVFSVFYGFFIIVVSHYLNKKKVNKNERNSRYLANKAGRLMSVKVATVLIIAASVGPVLSVTLQALSNGSDKEIQITLPENLGEWQVTNKRVYDWLPKWINPDSTVLKRYQNTLGGSIDIYIAYYANQSQGKEVINSDNKAFDRNVWKVEETSIVKQEINNEIIEYKEIVIRNNYGTKRVLWQWYMVNDKKIANNLEVKFYGLLAALIGKRDAATVIVSKEIIQDYSEEREKMKQFTESLALTIGK